VLRDDSIYETIAWLDTTDRDIAVTLAVAGVFGFALGFARPADQVAVETAQVLAGLVEYPLRNPFHVYHLKLWNLSSQLLALLLRLGMPERLLSLVLSGVLVGLAFQALALCTLAMSGDRALALVMPPWILAVGAYDLGVNYEMKLLGFAHTYGVVGTSYGLLVLALLGLGRLRAGLFLLGLAPAVHPSVGAWCAGVASLAFFFGGADARAKGFRNARFLVAGVALTLASLAAQLWLARSLDLKTTPLDERAVRAFVRSWDWHRRPVSLSHPVLVLTFGFLLVALAWLRVPRLRSALPSPSRWLLRALAISGALALAFCVAAHWQEHLPLRLVIAMPARYVNLTSLAMTAILVGLVGRDRTGSGAFVLLAIAAVVAALQPLDPLPVWLAFVVWVAGIVFLLLRLAPSQPSAPQGGRLGAVSRVLALAIFAATALVRLDPDPVVLLAVLGVAGSCAFGLDPPRRLVALRGRARIGRPAAAVAFVASILFCVARIGVSWGSPLDWLTDRGNDPFYAQVAAGTGILLTAGDLNLVQLRTRRPILLDGGGLDALPYVPETAQQVVRILYEVYGENLYRPSQDIAEAHPGTLMPDTGKWIWERRSSADWIALAGRFGFRDILTPADWTLALPRVAEGAGLILYHVPPS
jgi:hypothetical protein